MDFTNQLNEINKTIIYKLLNHTNLDNHINLFLVLLFEGKEKNELRLLWDADILEKSILVLDYIENEYVKADIINTILHIMCDIKYDYSNKKNYIIILLKSYFNIIDGGYCIFKDIQDTLQLFSMLGVKKGHLVHEMLIRYDEKECVELLLKTGINLSKKEAKKHSNIQDLLEKDQKLTIRFDLVFHFYLLTDPDYIENIDIAGGYLKFYGNEKEVFTNWKFSSQGWDNKYVIDGIISKEEEAIFIEIGDFYNRCVDHFESFDLKAKQGERFDNLKVMLDRFTSQLRKKEVQDLVKRFFHGKTVFEVAFSLPISETDNI